MSKMAKGEYYMRMAQVVALRGTCDRRQVGAVIVHDDRVLSTGFNGAPRGMPECDDVGHLMIEGHCCRTIHAEANAILQVGANAIRRMNKPVVDNATGRWKTSPVTIYTTTSPCMGCMNVIINAHIARIVWGDAYQDVTHKSDKTAYARNAARKLGIEWDRFPLERLG